MLTTIYPDWTPIPNAQTWLDDGDYILVWDDILDDLSIA